MDVKTNLQLREGTKTAWGCPGNLDLFAAAESCYEHIQQSQ